eukprot:CAMPEP_0170192358 /NCGR_PEP_ID=MMETSP0040_2-20121228/53960_1 /TAXON_ID=641309 /ORGANISM="Lotharella oceanica, Strain CCMP622" /LENGTH=271 /DNA_ID=CAMNT_0010440691 /DNA_START=21 /DNA_END=836 /DNA_ORIENTATION=-
MSGVAREAAAGALAGFATEALLYPLDAYKTHQQYFTSESPARLRWKLLYRGVLTVTSIGAGPCYGVFFAVNETVKHTLVHSLDFSPSLATLPAAITAAFPAAVVYIPADTIKKRTQTGIEANGLAAIRSIATSQGLAGFFVGWRASLIRDVPFTSIKIFTFQQMAMAYTRAVERKNISPSEAAVIGGLSGVTTAVVTNPIDVINTRMKSHATHPPPGILALTATIVRSEGMPALFAGLAPRVVLKAMTGTFFWGAHRRFKHWIDARCGPAV